jgi:hypothetical protein
MFAYLIIGIELAILYFVFWVVFIREPKPREIRAELWGRYQGVKENSEIDYRKSTVTLFNNPGKIISFLPSRIKTRLYRMTKLRSLRRRHHHHIKPRCSCKRHEVQAQTNNWHRVPVRANIQEDLNRQLAEKFLLVLNKTLNKFSAKIPY